MKDIIVGYGEIGKAVHKVVGGEPLLVDLDLTEVVSQPVDIMHVCFTYSEDFTKSMGDYLVRYQPSHIIIYSTVPIGTTKHFPGAVHSPIEGRHPNLEESFRRMQRWIGANDEEGQFFKKYFNDLGFNVRLVASSDFTEFLKLRSTAKYGINIVWTDYEKKVADKIGMPFELIKELDTDYNALYKSFDMDWARRYVLDPPNGKIGGHCVVPNAFLLDEQYPDDMLKRIKEYL